MVKFKNLVQCILCVEHVSIVDRLSTFGVGICYDVAITLAMMMMLSFLLVGTIGIFTMFIFS